MRNLITSLVVFSALTSVSLAVPFTMLTGVYRFTKLTDGTVSIEGGSLYSSGTYTTSVTESYTADYLATVGLDAASLAAISGKTVTGADYIDSLLATAAGRENLANYSFSSASYSTDRGRVYIISAGGSTPKVPTITISATKSKIMEGGQPSAIVFKLSKPASDELIVRYALGGTAKIKSDYTGPKAARFVEIPKGKTTFRIPVSPVDDKAKESSETLVFELAKNDGYKIGASKVVTIRINDND